MSYTRNHAGLPNSRGDTTIPRFHVVAVKEEALSAIHGRPMFRDEERVQFLQPGSLNSHVAIVTDEHRRRWPEQYAAFKAGTTMATVGTPLEQWPMLTRSMVAELKAQEIHTVEQCAALSDEVISRSRSTGMRKICVAAKAYLDDAEMIKQNAEYARQNELMEMRNAQLEAQMAAMQEALDRIQAQAMLRDATPPPAQTYIPGDHDPLEKARQANPVAPSGGSALDEFQQRASRRQKAAEGAPA